MSTNINSIAVLGAGTMGAGIAALAADKDCKVLLLAVLFGMLAYGVVQFGMLLHSQFL